MRAGLKSLIESTHFAEAYVFESEGASTLTAGQHYLSYLEDSDVCIFFIDNKDGVPNGVQIEIDRAKKCEKKSLFYFCDQFSKDETPLQKSLKSATHAKMTVVHSFEDLIQRGTADIIEDLVLIYKSHCKGRMISGDTQNSSDNNSPPLISLDQTQDAFMQKEIFSDSFQCNKYLCEMILGDSQLNSVKTNCLDKLSRDFLPVLFEGTSIEKYDLVSLLDEIKVHQSDDHYAVTAKRWEAISAYYSGNLADAVERLEEAHNLAKTKSMPDWLIQDILIDLRNCDSFLKESKNEPTFESQYQQELDNDNCPLHYPLLDRYSNDLKEKILKSEIKRQIQSPHEKTLIDNLDSTVELLANTFVISVFNGSLIHMQMIYEQIMVLLFFICKKYSNWDFRVLLLKMAIISDTTANIDKLIKYYDEILSKLNASDAASIYYFTKNKPVPYQQFIAKLKALKTVGYFLNDEDFEQAWNEVKMSIFDWIEADDRVTSIDTSIYECLTGICLRISQEDLAVIYCMSIECGDKYFLRSIIESLYRCLHEEAINIKQLSKETAERFLAAIISIVSDENNRGYLLSYFENVLSKVRNQDIRLTRQLDKAISKYMPAYYCESYKLDTTTKVNRDLPIFIQKYIELIKKRNDTQGREGKYTRYVDRPHLTIKNIIRRSGVQFDQELLEAAFLASCDTLMQEQQTIIEKVDAFDLLVYLARAIPDVIKHQSEMIKKIKASKAIIESGHALFAENINDARLNLPALLFYTCLGDDVWIDMIEVLTDIADDIESQIHASDSILSFLQADEKSLLNPQVESIILQNSIKWCKVPYRSVRWNAVRILFILLNNHENHSIVCNQLVKLMDTDNAYIKNSILHKVHQLKKIDRKTHDYILQKASLDTDYAVRKVWVKVTKSH